MTRLYTNENIALSVVQGLQRRGYDVLTSHDAGRANLRIPDEQVLLDAAREERALVTHNYTDFRSLHQSGVKHAGIVAPTVDADSDALAGRIHTMLTAENPLEGKLIRVTKGGYSMIPK